MRGFIRGMLALGLSTTALGANHVLYRNNVPVAGYDEIVESVRAGDTIEFSDGKKMEVKRVLGHGNTTFVFSLGDGKAVRVDKLSFLNSNDAYWHPYQRLRDNGVPTLRVFEGDSYIQPGKRIEYLVVEQLDIRFNANDFFDGTGRAQTLSTADRARIREAFLNFAEQTARLSGINDLIHNPPIWNGERWLLMDFLPPIVPRDGRERNVFTGMFENHPDLLRDIATRIARRRQELDRNPCNGLPI